MSTHWFTLHVGTNREEKARRPLAARVAANDLARLIPSLVVVSEKLVEVRDGERLTRERKVYPGYVLTEIETLEDGTIPPAVFHLIRETLGRAPFVGAPDQPDRPRPLSPEEVASLTRRLERAPEVPVTVDFERGERVRVKEGSFAGFDGTVEVVVPEKGLVRVSVLVFGRPTAIDFEYWKVEKTD